MNITGINTYKNVNQNTLAQQKSQSFGMIKLTLPSETREVMLNSNNLWNGNLLNKLISTGVMAAGAVQKIATDHLGNKVVSKIAIGEAVDGARDFKEDIVRRNYSLLSSTFSRITANIEGLKEIMIVHRPSKSRSPFQIPEVAFKYYEGGKLIDESVHSYPINDYFSLDLSGDSIVRGARNIAMDASELIPELKELGKSNNGIKIEGPTFREKYEATKALANSTKNIAVNIAGAQVRYGVQSAKELFFNR